MFQSEIEPLRIAKMRLKIRPGYRLSAKKKAELRAEISAWERDNVPE